MAVEQRQCNDFAVEQIGQVSSGASLCCGEAARIHRCCDWTVEINLSAACNPSSKVPVGQDALQDSAFRNNEYQPGLVGGDFAQRRKNAVFSKDNELGEIAFNEDAFHRARYHPSRLLSGDITPDRDTKELVQSIAVRGFGTTPRQGVGQPLDAVVSFARPGKATPPLLANPLCRSPLLHQL